MKYRKFRGDALFTGHEFLCNGEVLVTDEGGRIIEIIAGGEAGDVEMLHGTLCPGFINAHCHLELSWMKELVPQHTGMIDFLLAVIQTPRVSETQIHDAAILAEDEMIRSGIIAVGDICNTTATLPVKIAGNLYYHNFIETMGFVAAAAEQRFNQALQVFRSFAENYAVPMDCNSIVPHSPYSVSEQLFDKITKFPGNRLISIHNQEHPAENEFFLEGTGDFHRLYKAIGVDSSFHKGYGKTSVQQYLPWFLRNQSVILVHNTETSSSDLEFIHTMESKGISTWFCLCANANLYINNKLPDVASLSMYNDKIILGTDSLASNSRLNILEEMKTIHKSFPSIPVSDLLRWATINGSRALGIDDETGSLEAGKQPGIVLIEGVTTGNISPDAKSFRIL